MEDQISRFPEESRRAKRFLLVDDSPLWVKLLGDALLREGFEVETRNDGLAAIEYLNENSPDVVLLDYFLPKIDGARVARYARSQAHLSGVKILILSGAADDIFPSDAAVADAVLAKDKVESVVKHIVKILEDLEEPEKALKYVFTVVKGDDVGKRSITKKIHRYKILISKLYEALGEVVIEMDEKGRALDFNKKALELIGRAEMEIVGRDIREILSLSTPSPLDAPLQRIFEESEEEVIRDIELTLGKRFLRATLCRISLEEEARRIFLIMDDITERKIVEELIISAKIKERQRLLEDKSLQAQKLEAIGRLACGIAHDFNNLMAAIMLHTGMIAEECKQNEGVMPHIEQIKKASEYAIALGRRLLTFSREQTPKFELLNLNAIIIETKKMLKRMIGDNIEIELKLEEGLKNIRAEKGQIEVILLNLITNARDAMPEGGKLTIRTWNASLNAGSSFVFVNIPPGEYVAFSVEDTGTGISKEALEHLFEPFFTTKEKGKGSGMGLATVYNVVRQTGGDIAVKSGVGEGATFTIYLPAANDEIAEEEGEGKEETEDVTTVLLVEDDNILRDALKSFLEKLGYNVLTAANGEEALKLSDGFNKNVHLLITDIVMPGINGVELSAIIKKTRPFIRVLWISGYMKECAACPANDAISDLDAICLDKPFSTDAFLAAIKKTLGDDSE
ncbi:MAG: hypothetical protein Kow0090_16470 [Myxococcota bacterium]